MHIFSACEKVLPEKERWEREHNDDSCIKLCTVCCFAVCVHSKVQVRSLLLKWKYEEKSYACMMVKEANSGEKKIFVFISIFLHAQ